MQRTVISLDREDKAWLDRRSRELGKSMTSLVRDAVALLRARDGQIAEPSFDELLERTSGTWKQGDGLAWQRRMRSEWQDR